MDTRENFGTVAEEIFRGYLRSAVILDDQFPEQGVPLEGEDDESQLITQDAPEDSYDIDDEAVPPPLPHVNNNLQDARLLWDLQRNLINSGVLSCGLRYRSELRDLAIQLAERADIVVLDWHLVDDDGAEAIEILKRLQQKGIQFICIFTGQGKAGEVRRRIEKDFSQIEEIGNGNLRIGNLIIAVRLKAGIGSGTEEGTPELVLGPDNLFPETIKGLARTYGGLIQLTMLEMTSEHRNQLPCILERIGSSIDLAVLLEAADKDSPVSKVAPFLAVLIDEWRSHLERRQESFKVLSPNGRSAYGAALGNRLDDKMMTWLKDHLQNEGIKGPKANSITANPDLLKAWLSSGLEIMPPPPDIEWKEGDEKRAARAVINALANNNEKVNGARALAPFLHLDILFQQQLEAPKYLTQGTIVAFDSGAKEEYAICTTPLCDAERPEIVDHIFTFVQTQQISLDEVMSGKGKAPFNCVVEYNKTPLCLRALVKQRVSLRVENYLFDFNGEVLGYSPFERKSSSTSEPNSSTEITNAESTVGEAPIEQPVVPPRQDVGRQPLKLRRIAQLRPSHALALSAAASADSIRVGVDRVELIRLKLK